jgi:DNA repair exonuclease SbcCD nuclease subunit
MKVCVYSDNHFCRNSSIIRSNGSRFSKRLENQINSIEWVEELALSHGAESIFCLGDFFDNNVLTADEITALQSIQWNEIPKVFLAGNHEMQNAENSSALIFNILNKANVFLEPMSYTMGNCEICFLPYISETNRKSLVEYFGEKPTNKNRVIFSHNDVAGIQMGQFISKEGFSVEEIDANCDLFINGHIHNCSWFSEKGINIGNLTGQNFSEDAFRFEHIAIILDTETLHINYYENPYAFNFYKLDYTTETSIDNINETDSKIKNNAVLTIKCKEGLFQYLKDRYIINKTSGKVSECRITLVPEIGKIEPIEKLVDLETTDHIKSFYEYCVKNFDDTDMLREELEEICK